MDPLTIASLGIGAIQGIQGLFQKSAAAKLAASNPRPVYNIQQPILDNQALAEAQAGQGLDAASKQVYSSGAERGLSASINAILQGGGSVNNIGDLYDNYQGGISKLALVDAQARVNNVRQLVAQNNAYAGELDKQFQVNQYGPYADRVQAAVALQKQGNDNLWKGVNTAFGALQGMQTANMYKQETNNLYGQPQPTDTPQSATLPYRQQPSPYPQQLPAPQYIPPNVYQQVNNTQGFVGPLPYSY